MDYGKKLQAQAWALACGVTCKLGSLRFLKLFPPHGGDELFLVPRIGKGLILHIVKGLPFEDREQGLL